MSYDQLRFDFNDTSTKKLQKAYRNLGHCQVMLIEVIGGNQSYMPIISELLREVINDIGVNLHDTETK